MPLGSQLTPVGSNFIKDWPGQNSLNSDSIDSYAGPNTMGTFTPVLTSTGVQPVLGTGIITGGYYTIFDQVFYWGEWKFGTGSSKGGGTYQISLPFTAKINAIPASTGSGGGPIIGVAQVWDESAPTARQPCSVQLRTADLIMFSVRNDTAGAGRAIDGGDIPIVWGIGDGIKWSVRYQRVS